MIRELTPAEWTGRLADLRVDDVYYAAGYVVAAALLEEGRPAFLELRGPEGDVLFPCVVRPLPGGGSGTDVVSPYGYGGPIAVGEMPPTAAFDQAYEEWSRARGVVSTFIRFHPLLRNHAYAPRRATLAPLAGTVVWDVSTERDLFAGMNANYRRGIRGMMERATTEVSRGGAALVRFRTLYELTMRRNGATPFYFFSDVYWNTLVEQLGERALFFEVRAEGELIASMLALVGRPWVHCHLLGMSEVGRTKQAGKFLYYEVARWAQSEGFKALHLGGGVGGRLDSLLTFKLGFAKDGLTPAFVGKIVHDPAQYRQLAGSDEIEGFFPAYRHAAV